MTSNVNIRSNVILAITQQKFSCFQRDHYALTACLESITAECDRIGSDSDANVSQSQSHLSIKAHHLSKLRLANPGDILRVIPGAIAFLKLGEADVLLKEDVQAWNACLDKVVMDLKRRIQHGIIFAEVLQEWLLEKHSIPVLKEVTGSDEHRPTPIATAPAPITASPPPPSPPPASSFVPIDFLKSHNASDGLMNDFNNLATATRKYGLELLEPGFIVQPFEVKNAIEAIASDARLNSPEVRAQLKELGSLPDVLDEMAGAFTITRRHLGEWEWSPTGIRSDLQKHLSGKKRAFLNVEISETIFLETVAQQWSAHFKEGLMRIRTGDNWPAQRPLRDLQTGNEKRLESMLGMLQMSRDEEPDLRIRKGGGVAESGAEQSLCGFMAALRSGSYAQYTDPDTGGDQNTKATTRAGNRDGDGWGGVIDASRTAASFSDVFRHLRTDIALTKTIAPTADIVVLHSDLEDFGPSVPHEITLKVLRFFGIPEGWLSWFEKYLKLPQLDAASQLTTATAGTPFGLSISLLVNELLLVLLDCALATDTGIVMNRRHDDFWVWSTRADQVERAWTIMNEFTTQTMLSWNKSKTGCVTVHGSEGPTTPTSIDSAKKSALPRSPLKWGLLHLHRDGKWLVDENDLESLAASMRDELETASAKSYLSRINLWNKYHGYITRNVGPITKENSSSQISLLLSILQRFQKLVIGSTADGSKTLHDTLVEYFQERFPAHSEYPLTNAILSWPIQLGGFQLHPHALRAMVCSQPMTSGVQGISTSSSSGDASPTVFAEELAEAKYAYDRYCQAWSSEWGERAWDRRERDREGNGNGNGGRGISTSTWGTIIDRPDPVTETDFVRWHALHTRIWKVAYDQMTVPIDVTPSEIAEMADSVYGLLARCNLGEMDKSLVDKKLVPTHVAADIDAGAREMFASLAL